LVEVRAAKETDLAAVLALHGTDDRPASDSERATWAEMLRTPNLLVRVADDDGQVVGTASMLVMPNLGYDCHPSAFIEAVVVDESSRRMGVGRALLRQLLQDATDRSCRKVQLLSHKRHRDDGAFAFYESLGFTAEAEGFRLYLST
jgi:ribosomal protein S18 acetylase RimI-like enzyme